MDYIFKIRGDADGKWEWMAIRRNGMELTEYSDVKFDSREECENNLRGFKKGLGSFFHNEDHWEDVVL